MEPKVSKGKPAMPTRLFLFFFITLWFQSANADLLACLEPGIKETLLGFPGQNPADVTRTPLQQLADTRLPPDFDLLGVRSAERFNIASYRTSANEADAINGLTTSLVDSAWITREQPVHRITGGIQIKNMPQHNSLGFCHDEHGTLHAGYVVHDKQAYVVMFVNPRHRGMSCQQMMSPSQHHTQLMDLPTLTLPDDVTKVHGTGYGGGNNEEASSKSSFNSPRSLADLEKFFSAQIPAQGFALEDSWLGNTYAGSAWLSADEKHHLLIRISVQSAGRYKVTMTKTARSDSAASATHAISISS